MKSIIEFKNISKQFPGVMALRNVSFSIRSGEVHALVGENGAGKSTLMHILGGHYQPDEGCIVYKGEEVVISNQHAALSLGIGMVYQELKLCPNLTVTENIFLGREREAGKGRVNWKLMREETSHLLRSLGSSIDPNAYVRTLSIADQQLVEIAKSISKKADIIVMDEPTSALTLAETDSLFRNIRMLKGKGVTIIYISHRMEEIFEISDRISVLRDGQYLGTFVTAETSIGEIVTLIAGKELITELSQSEKLASENKAVALEVEDLNRSGKFSHVSFRLYEKEILGIYGLQGSGRTEVLETLFGLASDWSGNISVFGAKADIASPWSAIKIGIAMIPEDRRRAGIFADMDVEENINIANPADMSGFLGFLKRKTMHAIAASFIDKLGIKAKRKRQLLRNLSGGNQQKVVISKWLATKPRILLVDELTRGIDVGAKADIYKILHKLRDEGLSVLLVSSELPEVLSVSDRVLVMRKGSLVAELSGPALSKENIVQYALQG